MLFRYYYGLLVLFFSLPVIAQPLFDTHLHYSANDAQHLTPQAVLQLLDKNAIAYAAVTGTPSAHVHKLYQLAPNRIVPLLSIYRHRASKSSWTKDNTLLPYLEKELERGYWKGIGEIHVFSDDRHSSVFEKVITLATTHQLPLLIHSDPAVIDKIYEIAPEQVVIWAHAGAFPYPDLVSDYLRRHPNLSIDVSMRDERIAPGGNISDDWYELFVTYPNRVLIGVDTYSTSRWNKFSIAVETIRNWLVQLPEDTAAKIAFINAAKIYKKPVSFTHEDHIQDTIK